MSNPDESNYRVFERASVREKVELVLAARLAQGFLQLLALGRKRPAMQSADRLSAALEAFSDVTEEVGS